MKFKYYLYKSLSWRIGMVIQQITVCFILGIPWMQNLSFTVIWNALTLVEYPLWDKLWEGITGKYDYCDYSIALRYKYYGQNS